MDTCKYMCIVNNLVKVALYIYSLLFLKEGREKLWTVFSSLKVDCDRKLAWPLYKPFSNTSNVCTRHTGVLPGD